MPRPPQKMIIRAAAPYIQIMVLDETPKVGKNEGSQDVLLVAVSVSEAGAVVVGSVVWSSVLEGFSLTGRSG